MSGFVTYRKHTSFWSTMDGASSVSYCVIVVGICLVSIVVCWNVRTMWSSLYASHRAISSCLFVTVIPLSFVADQHAGRFLMISMYCVSMQVSRSSDKWAIVWGCGISIGFSVGRLRLRLLEALAPSGTGGCLACCCLSELWPRGLVDFSFALVDG